MYIHLLYNFMIYLFMNDCKECCSVPLLHFSVSVFLSWAFHNKAFMKRWIVASSLISKFLNEERES